ncbi:hypothetical protein ACEQ8H_007056 [Pleosporales sp. CAS-2024a]
MLSLALLAAVALRTVAADVPAGVIAVPLTRNYELTAYFAEVLVGTPPQKMRLLVDTGSPFYSFLDPRNPVCVRQDCKTFGTFDNTTSLTCQDQGPGFNDALIVLGNGNFLSDTIVLGGVTAEKLNFGYTSQYVKPGYVLGNVTTILGLSMDCQFGGSSCTGSKAVLLPGLKNASLINAMSTSIYLGPDNANVSNAQLLIGGAYDKAKVDGELFTLDMVNPHDLKLANGQTNTVNVTAIEVVLDGGVRTTQTYGVKDVGSPVLLDTGIASWYMPKTIFDAVFKGLGGQGDVTPGMQLFVTDCIYRDPNHSKSYIAVSFGSAGTITIPLSSLVSQFPDGTCGSFIGPRGDVVSTMGDPFLRNVYFILDQENFTVTFGQVKHTDDEDIVPIPTGGFKVV